MDADGNIFISADDTAGTYSVSYRNSNLTGVATAEPLIATLKNDDTKLASVIALCKMPNEWIIEPLISIHKRPFCVFTKPLRQEALVVETKTVCVILSMLFLLACSRGQKAVARLEGGVELLRPFTFGESCDMEDPLLQEILTKDMRGKKTPLALLHYYAEILNKGTSHERIAKKLDKLFLCCKPPEDIDGYFHGITISLKSGWDIYGLLEDTRRRLGIGEEYDVVQALYGRVFSGTSPWAGKSFKKLNSDRLKALRGGFEAPRETAYLGINSFRIDNSDVVNNIANYLLPVIIDMEGLPDPERKQESWLHSRGGLFIAQKALSVAPEHPHKEVMALNYRWESLTNRLPNRLLIDEIVEISDGLFLGKLFYATSGKRLFKEYDPLIENEDYEYRNFGYFTLMDDSWVHEKDALFPELAYSVTDNLDEKFTTFIFEDSAECLSIQEELGNRATILHYLQDIYERIQKGDSFKDDYFEKLHRIFMCGKRPDGISGFFHGAVVTFKNGGFLRKYDRSVLNDLYPAVRPFSPWTGKTFAETTVEDIKKYIGKDAKHYDGLKPIILGTNTYKRDLGLSLPATVFIEHLKNSGMVVAYPDENEQREEIYVKSFYFIATNGKSVMPNNKGRGVLWFNYRWPELHTMPPDNLCRDELVKIADGLYLGQLLYSMKPKIPYTPDADPGIYQYDNFGYFILMDDDWHAIKEFIYFDTN